MSELTLDYVALRREVGAVALPRDFVEVRGPDAMTFLQGQLSQDVANLGPGDSALSFVLQPQGKVDALVRVTRLGDDVAVLDVDGGWLDHLVGRLMRFKLRVKADITPLEWRCLAIRGPQAAAAASRAAAADEAAADDTRALAADWPGLPGVDLVGPDPRAGEVRLCSLDAYEAVRIEAGVPAMGRELTEATIPGETGIVDRTVSFTKGCFTGQELVARIDSRGGKVPRRLRGVLVGTNVIPPVGATVEYEGRPVGTLTSVAESLDRRAPVALAYIRREVEPPGAAVIRWDGAPESGLPAVVESLPLVP